MNVTWLWASFVLQWGCKDLLEVAIRVTKLILPQGRPESIPIMGDNSKRGVGEVTLIRKLATRNIDGTEP